jgi:hypothetical protein
VTASSWLRGAQKVPSLEEVTGVKMDALEIPDYRRLAFHKHGSQKMVFFSLGFPAVT